VFTRRVALPTFIQPYHPAPCSLAYVLYSRRRRRRSRYHRSPRPIHTRTQAPKSPGSISRIPLPGHHHHPDKYLVRRIPTVCHSYLWPVSNQRLCYLSHSILPLLQVRTATGRDSPDRYDNLIELAPLLHRSQSFLWKNNNNAFLPSLVNCEDNYSTTSTRPTYLLMI